MEAEVTMKSSMSKMQNDRCHRHSNEAVHVKGVQLWLPLLWHACMHEIINCIHHWFPCLPVCGGSISFMEYCHVSLHYVSDYCKCMRQKHSTDSVLWDVYTG